jgi:arylsulfatase A-like enzyme
MTQKINRREFLKIAALSSIASVPTLRSLDRIKIQSSENAQPNVLIIVLDALSARHMSLYGYPRQTTPNIDHFAERSTVFHNHYSGGSFTTPGTASLLSGALPWSHHAVNLQGMVNNTFVPRNIFNLTPQGTFTTTYSQNLLAITLLYQFRGYLDALGMPRKLAIEDLEYSDRLFKNDYNISYFGENVILRGNKRVAGSLFLSPLFHWISPIQEKQINQTYKQAFPDGVPNQDYVYFRLEDSIDWTIEQVNTMQQPYLAYFHFLPPHGPYTPRYDFLGMFQDNFSPPVKPESFASEGFDQPVLDYNRLKYDQYLAYADSEFGRLVSAMEASGALDNTCLILTSDHGELFERGIRGHVTPVLYESIVRVPLVIARPGSKEHQDVFDHTSCIDLVPTLMHIYGQNIPEWVEGRILPTFNAPTSSQERTIFTMDSKGGSRHGPLTTGTFMSINGDYKLIHYIKPLGETVEDELYDLAKDPEELENLITTRGSTAAELQDQLAAKLARANQPYATQR